MSLWGVSIPYLLWNQFAKFSVHLNIWELDRLGYAFQILSIHNNIDVPLREVSLFECIFKLLLFVHKWAFNMWVRLERTNELELLLSLLLLVCLHSSPSSLSQIIHITVCSFLSIHVDRGELHVLVITLCSSHSIMIQQVVNILIVTVITCSERYLKVLSLTLDDV